jgi:hypothetical protein
LRSEQVVELVGQDARRPTQRAMRRILMNLGKMGVRRPPPRNRLLTQRHDMILADLGVQRSHGTGFIGYLTAVATHRRHSRQGSP